MSTLLSKTYLSKTQNHQSSQNQSKVQSFNTYKKLHSGKK